MALSGTVRQLDRRAVGIGLLVGLVVVGALGAVSFVLAGDGGGEASSWRPLVFVATFAGFGLAGGVAGALSAERLPHTHGALVAFLTYVITQAALLVASAAAERDVEASGIAMALSSLLAAGAGVIGAMIAARRVGAAT